MIECNDPPRNYGREHHTRWARTWLRWFVVDVGITVAMAGLVAVLAATATNMWPTDRIPAVIVFVSAIAIIYGPFTRSIKIARKTWRHYTDDRDKAREADQP